MENLKHTKGEWRYFKANDGHIIKTDKGCIADVYCNIDDLDSAEEANAKLIAAAPDMLEALQDMVFIFESISEKLPTPAKEFNCFKKAINAINKATK